jgi:hypothetical protein
MWIALNRAGEPVARCTVERLMRAHGICGAKRRGKPWRRSRNRKPPAGTAATTRAERRDRMARVQVADDVWADFRAAALHRPLSEVLGELVTREVDRYRSRRLRDGQLDPREITEALAYAARQQADLAIIVERLERLQRLKGGEARGEVFEDAPPAREVAEGEERGLSPRASGPQPIFSSPLEREERTTMSHQGE